MGDLRKMLLLKQDRKKNKLKKGKKVYSEATVTERLPKGSRPLRQT